MNPFQDSIILHIIVSGSSSFSVAQAKNLGIILDFYYTQLLQCVLVSLLDSGTSVTRYVQRHTHTHQNIKKAKQQTNKSPQKPYFLPLLPLLFYCTLYSVLEDPLKYLKSYQIFTQVINNPSKYKCIICSVASAGEHPLTLPTLPSFPSHSQLPGSSFLAAPETH